jgi:hypothetical protein
VVQSPGVELSKGPCAVVLDYETRGINRLFSRQLIELLLENGASLSDENNDGETPLDWATGRANTARRSGSGGTGGMGGMGGGMAMPLSPAPRSTVERDSAVQPSSGMGYGGMGGSGLGGAGALGF